MKKTAKERMITRILLNYAFTFMMIELADAASQLIDGMIVSRHLGPTALASIGLGDPSFKMFSLFAGLFAAGIQSVCSVAMGAGDRKKTDEAFSCGLTVTSAIAAAATILGFVFLTPLCRLFGADGSDPELFSGLYHYLRGWFFGTPGFILFTVLSPMVTLDGNKRLVTLATITQSAINIAGDYLAVTVLNMGTGGVGFFTGFGFDVAAAMLVLNFFRPRTAIGFRFVRPKLALIREYLVIGMPRLTKYACKMLSPLLVNRTVIAVGGSAAMAAMSIRNSVSSFFLVAGAGIGASVNLLSQVFFNEKDRESLRLTARAATRTAAVICTVLAAIMFTCAKPIARLFFPDTAAEASLAVTMLRFLALSIALNGFNQLVLDYLQGTQKILPSHLQTMSHRLVFLALSTFVLGRLFGTIGLFIAIPVSEVLVLLTYLSAALFFGREKDVTDALLLLPDRFGEEDGQSLSLSATKMEEVVGISERVHDFCIEHGIDARRAYFASLALEELAGNVVSHGFTKDNKEHDCEVRVMIENEDVVLRIRDDCRYFDLRERYEAMKDADTASNVGIRLVYGIAKDVNYIHLLNTNTLIIRI